MRVTWAPAALADIGRIYDYITEFNPLAAADLARRLKECGDTLRDVPERGRPIGGRRRELLVIWPYVIRYRIADEGVPVLRHGHQRPTE